MALITHTPHIIEVELTNRVINDTVIKQKAVFQSLNHVVLSNKLSKATITILVTMYASINGGYGAVLIGNGFQPYYVDLVADNNTIVDAATGAILAINTTYLIGNEWIAVANAYKQPVMFQGDFFELVRDNQPIIIGNLIRQHITQADHMGKFA